MDSCSYTCTRIIVDMFKTRFYANTRQHAQINSSSRHRVLLLALLISISPDSCISFRACSNTYLHFRIYPHPNNVSCKCWFVRGHRFICHLSILRYDSVPLLASMLLHHKVLCRNPDHSSKAVLTAVSECCQNAIAPSRDGMYRALGTCLVCSKVQGHLMETSQTGKYQE